MKVDLVKDRARPLDDLMFDTPLCPNCGESTDTDTDDDSWWCGGCGGTWERGGVDGTIEEPCPARRAVPSPAGTLMAQCRRTAGHDDWHFDRYGRTW